MKKILVVDNEPGIIKLLSYFLGNKDTIVITSSSLKETEEALQYYTFDLAVLDIKLSGIEGIEGLELLSYVKDKSPKTEVIIMTDYSSSEIVKEAYRRGASYYCEKPFDVVDLILKAQHSSSSPGQLNR